MPFPSPAPTAPSRLDANVSASQLKTWRLCRRKWWFEKIAKLKEREKHHFLVGHTFHSIAERYLTRQAKTWEELFPAGWDKGLEGDERDWARRMAEEAVTRGLWQAKDGIAIEFPIAFLVGREHRDARGLPLLAEAETYEEGGVRKIAKLTRLIDGRPLPRNATALPPFVGFIDQLDLSYNPPGIADHKTAKSRRYALTSEKLAQDTQVLSYAAVPLILCPDQHEVRLRHNVFLKDPAAPEPVYPVDAMTSLPQVVEHWDRVISDSEDMQRVRQIAPVPPDPKSTKRADNFHLVRSAIDDGRAKEACNCYGGCAFRDVCFGRSNAEQLVRRMDSPDPLAAAQQRAASFGLNLTSVPSTYRPRTGLIVKESPMVFAKPAASAPIAIGMIVFVIDPESPTQQFKATVLNAGNPGACDPMVGLWPDANVEPEVTSLSQDYVIQLPEASLKRSQDATAKLIGYADALKAAGLPAPGWVAKPASKAPSLVPAGSPDAEKLAKAVNRPEKDGKFGLAHIAPVTPQAPAAPAAAPAVAPAPAPEAIPQPTFVPTPGMQVRFLPTQHSYWSQFVGRTGTVVSTGASENGPVATVEIDGLPYPDVAVGRMEPANAPAKPAVIDWEAAKALVGQLVSVRVLGDDGQPEAIPRNGVCEALADGHVVMFAGGLKIPFTKVYSFGSLQMGDVPGGKLPKPPKVPGKRGRKSKAEKEAEAAAAQQAQQQQEPPKYVTMIAPTSLTSSPAEQQVPGITSPAPIVQPLFSKVELLAQTQKAQAELAKLAEMLQR